MKPLEASQCRRTTRLGHIPFAPGQNHRRARLPGQSAFKARCTRCHVEWVAEKSSPPAAAEVTDIERNPNIPRWAYYSLQRRSYCVETMVSMHGRGSLLAFSPIYSGTWMPPRPNPPRGKKAKARSKIGRWEFSGSALKRETFWACCRCNRE